MEREPSGILMGLEERMSQMLCELNSPAVSEERKNSLLHDVIIYTEVYSRECASDSGLSTRETQRRNQRHLENFTTIHKL